MASVSYLARTTTNNLAEYCGLLNGLRRAHRTNTCALHVAGDSTLILTQLRRRTPPKTARLKGIYAQCRRLADQVAVQTWTYHLRSFNKLADGLANIAMDMHKSVQVFHSDFPSLSRAWVPVLESLQGDVDHWLDQHEGTGALNPDDGVP
ncbi:hypothetical protein PHMEG_00011120 [Phytophthora megakarya]|uniref:RNase H type-1 domain-containing protein n=1 Tax=Phytophthora megakarya TaxID=4795 RepID=A0A225WDF4_9STRA|nr:hypothetical protein PHMEG_00011120 [Phytophthora megakarya]